MYLFHPLQDSDYRGTVRILVENTQASKIIIEKNTSWFQVILLKTCVGQLQRVDAVALNTDRGAAKFGSTGHTSTAYALQLHAQQEQQEAGNVQEVAAAEGGEAAEATQHQSD
jgi:hypothetical protein